MADARRHDPLVELALFRVADIHAEDGIRAILSGAARTGNPVSPPPLLARAARLHGPGATGAPGGLLALAEAIADALADYPVRPEDWDGLGARALMSYAEDNLRSRARTLAREATHPLVGDRDAALEEARSSRATWRWTEGSDTSRKAVIAIGRLRFSVSFRSSGDAGWSQSWGGHGDTIGFLDHLDRLALSGEPLRTGLFERIDAAIAEIDRAFLEAVGPEALRVDGIDARRNAHNLATYAGHAPDGYALEAIQSDDPTRATRGGVSGVRFVRLPEPAPSGP